MGMCYDSRIQLLRSLAAPRNIVWLGVSVIYSYATVGLGVAEEDGGCGR